MEAPSFLLCPSQAIGLSVCPTWATFSRQESTWGPEARWAGGARLTRVRQDKQQAEGPGAEKTPLGGKPDFLLWRVSVFYSSSGSKAERWKPMKPGF